MGRIVAKRREPNLILKLDVEKAYNRLDWTFLMDMLKDFGFGSWFIDLVFRTFSNNWFSFLINSEQAGYVKSFHRVRRGDPLSLAFSS